MLSCIDEPKFMAYVVFGRSVSLICTTMPFPRRTTEGFFFIAGDVYSSFCWSLIWTYSLNSIYIFGGCSVSTIVVKLLGSMSTITGGRVSFGPPVGVIVDAHLVSNAAPNSSVAAAVNADVKRLISPLFICRLLFCCCLILCWLLGCWLGLGLGFRLRLGLRLGLRLRFWLRLRLNGHKWLSSLVGEWVYH